MATTKDYAYLLKTISDETRLQIIQMLASEELCACHILEAFDITQPTLSYHMKLLVESDLVRSRKDGNWTRYALNHQKIDEVTNFFTSLMGNEITVREVENCK